MRTNTVREQILFVLPITLLAAAIMLLIFIDAAEKLENLPPPQQPVYPQNYNLWEEIGRQAQNSAWRNPWNGRKSDFPGGWD